jgi:peptide/nickel transport system permease protein
LEGARLHRRSRPGPRIPIGLGLGVPEPYPSWGHILSVSAAEYAQKAPRLVIFPGLAISLAVFGSNLLGDALRDTLDPRLRCA